MVFLQVKAFEQIYKEIKISPNRQDLKLEKKKCQGIICNSYSSDMIKQISGAFHIGFLVDPTSIKNESLFIEIEDFCLFKNELKHFINEV